MDKKQAFSGLNLLLAFTRLRSYRAIKRRIIDLFIVFHEQTKEKEIEAAIPQLIKLLVIICLSTIVFAGLLLLLFKI